MINQDGTSLEAAIKAAIQIGGFEDISNNIKIGFLYNDKTENTLLYLKHLIHRYNFIHAGFLINEGWYNVSDSNYIIPNGKISYGGHAVIICGYDQTGVYI